MGDIRPTLGTRGRDAAPVADAANAGLPRSLAVAQLVNKIESTLPSRPVGSPAPEGQQRTSRIRRASNRARAAVRNLKTDDGCIAIGKGRQRDLPEPCSRRLSRRFQRRCLTAGETHPGASCSDR